MTDRDIMEYDVVTVGAGPAGLAFAIRLKQLKPDIRVCVIEKASTIGAQILSGAVIEPEPLNALLPEWGKNPPPSCVPNSTSTGSASSGVRSTTEVSKTTRLVRSARIDASTAANTLEYTTDAAIDPDWSTQSTTSRCTDCALRP